MKKKFVNNKQRKKLIIYFLNIFLFCFIFIEILAISVTRITNNRNLINSLALATNNLPDSYTELYFPDHSALPSRVSPGQTISFKFTVHNLENERYNYPYEVYFADNGKNIEIDKGQFTLDQAGFKTVSEKYTTNKDFSKGQIVVNLLSKNQNILFWIIST
jgi:hypothetical protein